MAFPTIPTVAAGRVLTTNQADTSGTRTFPSLSSLTKNSGDLLIAIAIGYQSAGSSGAVFSSWGGSFTEFSDQMTTSGSTMCVGLAYKWSTGSETGTFTVTQASPTGHATLILLSIPGAHASTPPEAGTIANGTGSAADPGSFTPSGWAAEDTLWVALAASGMTSGTGSWTATGTTAPSNYTDRVDSNTTDSSTVGQTEGAVAFRQLNAASEDIGTAGVDTSNARNSALVIAVRPAVENPTGTGAITVPAATVAGTGAEVFTATGAVNVPSAAVDGSGVEVLTATGAITVPAAIVDAAGDHSSVTNPSGTGSITVPAVTVDGAGTHTPNPAGTGAISIPAATVAGAGELVLTGTGAVSVPAPIVDGTGAEILTAIGAIIGQAPTVDGDGIAANPVSGTGVITISVPTVAGSGLHTENVTGTGAIAVPAFTMTGEGLHVENATGSGSIEIPPAVVAGSGIQLLTGSGAITIQPPAVSGTGDHAEAVPVTGTGAISVRAATVTGIGVLGEEDDAILRGTISLAGELGGTVSGDGVLRGTITFP